MLNTNKSSPAPPVNESFLLAAFLEYTVIELPADKEEAVTVNGCDPSKSYILRVDTPFEVNTVSSRVRVAVLDVSKVIFSTFFKL